MVSERLPATSPAAYAARFRAAFTSRSKTRPHFVQSYVRSDRASLAFTAPQPEHILLDGNHRLARTTRPPFHVVLYSSCRRISPNEASPTCLASRRFFIIPATFRSSSTMTPYSRASLVVSLWRASLRWSATRPCALPRAAAATRQRFDGVLRCLVALSYGPSRRAIARFRRASLRSAPFRCRGLGSSSPVERTARVLIPRSTPT